MYPSYYKEALNSLASSVSTLIQKNAFEKQEDEVY
jgi:hypothetical protein